MKKTCTSTYWLFINNKDFSTGIWASSVLNSTKVPLHSDTYRVVCIGQHQSTGIIVIIAKYISANSGEILQASVSSWNEISYFSSHYFKSAAFRSGLKVWQLVINYRFLSIFCVISNCMIFYFMSERVGLLQCFYTFVSRNTKYIHIKSNSRCSHVTRKFSVNKTQLLHSHCNHKKTKSHFYFSVKYSLPMVKSLIEARRFKTIPLLKEVHSICVTLMEKLRENEFPLDTTVKVMGFVEARPISTYTKKWKNKNVVKVGKLICWTVLGPVHLKITGQLSNWSVK